jgi:gamma-glutamylcyclotransferase (GGCT)/AIG2-like uncharacterized protein YtfP
MTHRLFVYGTLAPGRSNAHMLADVPGHWEPATVAGRLIDGGWAAALGYPGIVLDEHVGEVAGLLFSSEHLPAHWSRLDAFEGDDYERVPTRVRTANGDTLDAYIYRVRDNRTPESADRR